MIGPLAHRAGPLFGVFLVAAALVFAVTPVVPAATAADPTAAPSGSVDPAMASTSAQTPSPSDSAPSSAPAPTPTPDPSASPAPDPTSASSPDPSAPSSSPAPDPTSASSPDPSAPSASPSAAPSAAISAGLHVPHAWLDDIDQATGKAIAGITDQNAAAVERFRVYEVRFQLVNDSDAPIQVIPTLMISQAGGAAVAAPAQVEGVGGSWIVTERPDDPDAPAAVVIPVDGLRLNASIDPAGAPVTGTLHLNLNPGATRVLNAHTFTEVAFAIRATSDAAWLETYTFSLDLGSTAVESGATISATMRAKPVIVLSGQRQGTDVVEQPTTVGLRRPTYAAAAALVAFQTPSSPTVHFDLSLTGDTCAACHSGHAGQASPILQRTSPQSNLCFSCHDGTGSKYDIKGQYSDPAVPPNDPATGSYYSHPATTLDSHVSDREDEFAGVSNRHSACADCHQPHNTSADLATQTPLGWNASGSTKGASGVEVANGAAGQAPTYTWQPTTTLEYQLCFKCHSGFTKLPAKDPAHPSRWALDKAIEFNPSNPSYHPVEAAGTNATAAMAASLSGTSQFKLWTFQVDQTIRCVNCHGDSRIATPATPPQPDALSAPHAVPNRGILMSPYRDRLLKEQGDPFNAADFALCFQCHAESPMADYSGDPNSATNFKYHGVHLNLALYYGGGGQDIDTDGAGQGNALCAECHFRIHGSTFAVDGQSSNSRLVNFSPNVKPVNGVISFTKTATGGTCTLICHGMTHRGWSYP